MDPGLDAGPKVLNLTLHRTLGAGLNAVGSWTERATLEPNAGDLTGSGTVETNVGH